MYKYFILIFLNFSLIVNAQEKPMDISDILSYKEFQEIKQFVLEKGQTKTYCNMYNNNPYYEFSEGIELYLNPIVPIVQLPGLEKEDIKRPNIYDTMVIINWPAKENSPYRQIHYIKEDTNTKKIYLSRYQDTGESMIFKESILPEYFENILKEIKQ